MEASGNEYVAQLLDRAATLLKTARDDQEADNRGAVDPELDQWMREYQAEKARFGQPLGSPAYVDAKRAARGEDTRTTGEDYDGRYDDLSLSELQSAADSRGLAKSGTKADLVDRLHQDDIGASAG